MVDEKPLDSFGKTAEETGKKLSRKGVSLKVIGIVTVIIVITIIIAFMFLQKPSLDPKYDDDVYDENLTPNDHQTPVMLGQRVVVNPTTQIVGVGDNVTVTITIYNATDLYGFQFNLEYNSSILEFKQVIEGTFLNENRNTDTFWVAPSTSIHGLINNLACVRKGQVGGVNGDGILTTITFTSLSSGTSIITLSGVKLSDSQVKATNFTSSNGEIIIQ